MVAPSAGVGRQQGSSKRAVTRPWIPLYSRVSSQLQSMLESVVTGKAGPTPAAATAAIIAAIADLPPPNPRVRG